jgi:hypothetical protein
LIDSEETPHHAGRDGRARRARLVRRTDTVQSQISVI